MALSAIWRNFITFKSTIIITSGHFKLNIVL